MRVTQKQKLFMSSLSHPIRNYPVAMMNGYTKEGKCQLNSFEQNGDDSTFAGQAGCEKVIVCKCDCS